MQTDVTIPAISAALPDRAITVRPPPTVGPASTAGLFVMLFGLLASLLWWLGPDLVADARIGGDLVAARTAKLGEARCRSRLAVFTVCDIAVTGAGAEAAPVRTIWYFFLGTAGEEPIALLEEARAAGAGAPRLTTNLGQARFYQRVLMLGLLAAVLAFCILAAVEMLRAAVKTRRALLDLSGQKLAALVVGMEGSLMIATRRRRWTYTYRDGEGATQRAFIELPSRLDPLFVSPDRKRALALQGPGGGVPLLLDVNLGALDLTDAEKEAFFAACRAALGRGELD